MTNYEAIQKMNPKHMERFLHQVYLAGLNNGIYAARHGDDSILEHRPFAAVWLSARAESATAFEFSEDGTENMLYALLEALLTASIPVMRDSSLPPVNENGASQITIDRYEIKVSDIKPLPEHKLWLRFNTGEEKVFDFKPLLLSPAFAILADPKVFNDVSLDYGIPVWANGTIDIAPSYLYDMATEEPSQIVAEDCNESVFKV